MVKFSDQQIKQLNHQSYLILLERFSVNEVQLINSRVPSVFIEEHPVNIVEQSLKVVRTSIGLQRPTRPDFKHYQDLTPVEILVQNCQLQVEL